MSPKKQIPILIKKRTAGTFVLDKISSGTLYKLSEKFSYLPPGYRYHPKFRLMGIKGVKIRLIRPDGSFPQGLLQDITTYLKKTLKKKVKLSNDVKEHILPIHDLIKGGIKEDIFSDFEFDGNPVILRDYQLGGVEAAFKYRNGVLNLSTGAGKCLTGDTEIIVQLPEYIIEKYKLD